MAKSISCNNGKEWEYFIYETHSAVKRPNAVFSKRMRSATDRAELAMNGCRSTRERIMPHYFYSEHFRVRAREIEKFK